MFALQVQGLFIALAVRWVHHGHTATTASTASAANGCDMIALQHRALQGPGDASELVQCT
jgi:hypothetical protein